MLAHIEIVTRKGDETSKQLNRDLKLETSKVFNLVFEATISERLPSNLVLWVNVCLVAQLLGVGCKLLEVCESSEADGFGCCSAPVLHRHRPCPQAVRASGQP